jgi:hypothetical protein
LSPGGRSSLTLSSPTAAGLATPWLRRCLLRLLLLVVCFNATGGVGLHAWQHLGSGWVVVASALQDEAEPSSDPEGQSGERLCAWCVAQVGLAPGDEPPSAWTAIVSASHVLLPGTAVPVPDGRRWPFAARDPPRSFG